MNLRAILDRLQWCMVRLWYRLNGRCPECRRFSRAHHKMDCSRGR
jgi:hypothetical protein